MRDFEGKRSTTSSQRQQTAATGAAPGKRTSTEMLPPASAPVQRKEFASTPAPVMPSGPRPTIQDLFGRAQRKAANAEPDTAAVHASAQRGIATSASPLPHGETIQRAFGRHDISGIQAHTGADAAASAGAMGAKAYASGEHVVLGEGADLHTVAHEAAHVVQQRAGVSLAGSVGQRGDGYERAANAAADAVVRGESAHALLGGGASSGGASSGDAPVQRKVPDDQEDSVLEHYDYMVTRHEMDRDAHMDALTDAIDCSNSAKDAIAYLEDNLSPTSILRALVRQKKFKQIVDEIKRAHNPAAAQRFDIQPTDDYAKVLPKGVAAPTGIPFGLVVEGRATTGKDAVIYIHQHWIERWVLEDQIGSLLNTIEHEATHAGQKNSSTTLFADDTDVMELEAYTHEILTVQQKLLSRDPDLPTQAQLTKAYRAGKAHFDKVEAGTSTTKVPVGSPAVATQRASWIRVEQIYPTLRKELGQRDEQLRTSYHEERRFQSLLTDYEQAFTKLETFEGNQIKSFSQDFRTLFSDAGKIYERLQASHQEMDDVAQARLTSQMTRIDTIDQEFDRYNRMGPRLSKAKRSAQSSSGLSLGGLGLLPPPPGGSGSLGSFSLAPPPVVSQQHEPDDWADFGAFESAPSGSPTSQQGGSKVVGATPTTTAMPLLTPAPAPLMQQPPPQAHEESDDDDDEFGEFKRGST